MKRFVSLLIGCSLAVAGVAMAQQPEQQGSPTKKKQQGAEKRQAAEEQPGEKAAKPQRSVAKERAPMNQPGAAATERGKGHKAGQPQQERANATQPETNVSGQAAATPGTEQGAKGKKGGHATAAEKAAPPAAGAGAAAAGGTKASAPPPNAAPSAPTATQQRGQAAAGGKAKKPDPQQVQQIKAQHQGFRAQPKPQQAPAVTYNQNYRIQGSESWTGPQYQVFRSYRPEWHDEGWYHSHYGRVELIGGGYYFFNNGYWFPAWGYNTSVAYYPYDGPIYVGHRAEPPDQVIADVQAELQQMGYYQGEVDGLVGPMTREALAAYQADSGLTQTAAIDQPTLDSLGLA